jgi:hypothetical protein
LWFGFEVVFWLLRKHFDVWTKIAVSIPVGVLLPSLLFFVAATFLGINRFHLVVHMIFLSFSSAFLLKSRLKRPSSGPLRPTRFQLATIMLSVLLSIVIVPHFYFPEPRVMHSVSFVF